MVDVYGDESTDETQRRVFAVVGVVGLEDAWQEIEAQWVARNAGIPFHAKDCDSNWGDYRHRSNQENKELYKDLAIMLANSRVGGWGFAIDLVSQRKVFPNAPDMAYYKCFGELVQAMINFTSYNKQDQVRFTFDMREESQYNTGLLYKAFVKSDEWKAYLHPEISFVCSKEHPRVQMADLFAREAMKALDNTINGNPRPMRKSWKALYDSGHFHIEAIREEWFSGLKSDLPQMEEHIGMSYDGYLSWLAEKNRHDNMTNLIEYMSFAGKTQ